MVQQPLLNVDTGRYLSRGSTGCSLNNVDYSFVVVCLSPAVVGSSPVNTAKLYATPTQNIFFRMCHTV